MILLVGPLPPPVHGASSVTLAVASLLEERGTSFRAHSTAPPVGARGGRYHFGRALACLRAMRGIAAAERPTATYLSISGGWGLAYDVLIAITARLRGLRLVIHHHSFAYLNKRYGLLAALIWIAGPSQRHIVLCQRMGALLQSTYPGTTGVTIISNRAFQVRRDHATARPGPLRTIGFLSNITREKGIDRFLDLVGRLRDCGWEYSVVVAGPVADKDLKTAVLRRCDALNVQYVGSVYGEARARFFASIDLMVLPTSYTNEAEPLVVIEAQRRGVPVAASDRGCIAEMIGDPALLLDRDGGQLEMLAANILQWTSDGEAFDGVRTRLAEALAARSDYHAAARDQFVALLTD